MTINAFGFENGANGTALTNEYTWADPAGSFVSVAGAGSSAVISTAYAAHGTRSALFIAATSSGTCYAQKVINSTSFAVVTKVRIEALPNVDTGTSILWLGNAASQHVSVELGAAGNIRLRNDANASAYTSVGTLPVGQWVRIELFVTVSPTVGTFRLAAYLGDSTTPIANMDSGLMSNQNTGVELYTTLRYGSKVSTNTNSSIIYFDDFDFNENATGFIGPYVATLPSPNVSLVNIVTPSSLGGTNGSITISWPPVAGATGYDADIISGTVADGFTAKKPNVSSPYTFTGLPSGTFTVAVRAKG